MFHFFISKIQRAFTFAEVMTVLLLIGVVMVLTLPSIQNSYIVNVTKTSFVDTMKEFNKGLTNYSIKDNSYKKLIETDLFSGDFAEKISAQFSPKHIGIDCWNGINIKQNLDGNGDQIDMSSLSCFVDGDETIYAFEIFGTESPCTTDLYNGAGKHKLKKSCGILYFDYNGKKAPNTFGKDVFAFIITDAASSFLYPVGGKLMSAIDDNESIMDGISTWENSCGENGNKDGRTCAGRIVDEDMKIKYFK